MKQRPNPKDALPDELMHEITAAIKLQAIKNKEKRNQIGTPVPGQGPGIFRQPEYEEKEVIANPLQAALQSKAFAGGKKTEKIAGYYDENRGKRESIWVTKKGKAGVRKMIEKVLIDSDKPWFKDIKEWNLEAQKAFRWHPHVMTVIFDLIESKKDHKNFNSAYQQLATGKIGLPSQTEFAERLGKIGFVVKGSKYLVKVIFFFFTPKYFTAVRNWKIYHFRKFGQVLDPLVIF